MEKLTKPDLIGAAPIDIVYHIIDSNPQIALLSFSTYSYRPQLHNPGQQEFWLSRHQVLSKKTIPEIVACLDPNTRLTVNSKVKLENQRRTLHIPLMDFQTPKSPDGMEKVIQRLKSADVPSGYLVETDASYHFYGEELVTEKQWVDFLGQCLLTSIVHDPQNIEQVADSRYIGHSLRRGYSSARISISPETHYQPRVVAKV